MVNIVAGTTFVVSAGNGDVTPSREEPAGLFHRDTRHLSRWEVRLGGRPLKALRGTATDVGEAVFVLVEPTGTIYRDPDVVLTRHRTVSAGFVERLSLANHGAGPLEVDLEIL